MEAARWSSGHGNQTATALTETILELFEVLTKIVLKTKKWGGYGRPGRPYGAGPVVYTACGTHDQLLCLHEYNIFVVTMFTHLYRIRFSVKLLLPIVI